MADNRDDRIDRQKGDPQSEPRKESGSSGPGRGQLDDAEQSQVDEDHNLSGASTWETLNGHQTNLEEEERGE